MRAFRQKLPAALLAMALLGIAFPAWSGGRDVPDRQSNDLVGPQRPDRSTPQPREDTCAVVETVSSVTIGGWTFELVWSERDGYRMRSSLWSDTTVPRASPSGGSCQAS